MPTRYLFDTCSWLDFHLAPELLAPSIRRGISEATSIHLASISLIEVARKVSIGKLTLTMPLHQWLRLATHPKWIKILPITPEIAIDSTRLPQPFVNNQGTPHKDPADQIIVATARAHGLTLLTSDKILLSYKQVNTLKSRT